MTAKTKTPPVAHLDENANRQMSADLEIGEPELALASYLEVDLQAPIEVQKQRLMVDGKTALLAEISMGLRLMSVKKQAGHGGFADVLAELGIPERAARRAMQTARDFASEGDVRRREQILSLGKSKGMLLLAQAPEIRERLLTDPDTAAEVVEATNRELENTIKSLERDLKRVQTEKNDLEQINAGLTKKKLKSDLRADTQLVRDECLHQQALCDYGAQALLKAWNAVVEEPENAPEHHLRREQIILAAHAAAAATANVLHEIIESAGDDRPLAVTSQHMLTAEEAASWAAEWDTLRSGLLAKDAARFDRAQADLPRDVGRPKGSKTKSEGKGV